MTGADLTLRPPLAATPRRPNVAPGGTVALLAVLVAAPAGAFVLDGADAFDGYVARLYLVAYVLGAAFGVLGAVLRRHQPANVLGPLTTAMAWCFAGSMALERYSVVGFPRGWPGVEATLWVSQWGWVPALWAIPTVLALRLPDGRLPGPRWRAVEAASIAGIAVGVAGWAFTPYGVVDLRPAVPLDNPVATGWGIHVYRAGLALLAAGVAGSMVGFVLRTRRARGVERARLLWALLGTAATAAGVGLGALTGVEAVSSVAVAFLPAGIAVAVVRHGLWDVDLVVRRSLVYGCLTAAVVLVYVATVGLLGGVLGRSVGAPLLATGVVAVLVQPARTRVQRAVNRLLYGDREDPYAALSRLGARLDATADRAALLDEATATVVRTLRLRGAAIEVDGEQLAVVGTLGPAPLEVPLVMAGERVGTLLVGVADGDDLRASDRRLLGDLARHVAAAAQAERLHRRIESSTARIVTAREEERRRIRRDLHDELGPTLAAIANEVERAALELGDDPAGAAARLDTVAARTRATVGDVRALVEGLRPAALDELGLDGAVRELARDLGTGTLGVSVETIGRLDGLPAAVDVAAYRIAGEALTNTVRHADASQCTIRLRRSPGALEVEVRDDGRGVPHDPSPGVGRRSMAERAAELGGSLEVCAAPGGGTLVRAVLPVAGA